VISGYYGFGNAGDEAVLAGIIASLRAASAQDIEIIVHSSDPPATMELHGIPAVNRYVFGDLVRSIRAADLVISGGGSLLQDVTSARSILYYLGVLRLARLLGRRTMIYAQGIGPINRPVNRFLARMELERTCAITVRDESSYRLLQDLGVRRPRMEITADPSFAIEPASPEDASEALNAAGVQPGMDLLGVALRPWPRQERWLEEAAAGISQAASELKLQPVMLAMQPSADLPIADQAARVMGIPSVVIRTTVSPRLTKAIAGSVGLMVAMRLHALIFAASMGVPGVALSYDPKVEEFARSMGMGVMDVRELAAADLKAAIVQAWNRRQDLSKLAAERAGLMREKALRSAKIACDMLAEIRSGNMGCK